MNKPKPKYNDQDKQAYLVYCRRYNEAARQLHTKKGEENFIALSLLLHASRGKVPKRWRSMSFIRSVGTGEPLV